jgi:hypothetical protein
MRSPSLDKFYTQIDKHILLAQSYTEIKDLFFIIKSCRLKPNNYIWGDRSSKLILYRDWFDEFGNSLKIQNNKRIKIVLNDLDLDRTKIVITDLYQGLSIDKVTRISKLCYICAGIEEDFNEECAIITFLGIDNYLRSFVYLYDEWTSISPLVLGMKNLKFLAHNRDVKYFLNSAIKENMPIPCIVADQWLTFMPPNEAVAKSLDKKYPNVAKLFINKEK